MKYIIIIIIIIKAYGSNFHPVWDWRGEGEDYRFRENVGVTFHWEPFDVGDVLGRERR